MDPFGVVMMIGDLAGKLACKSCGGFYEGNWYRSSCCQASLCRKCGEGAKHIIRRDGKRVCRLPGCGHEYD